MDVHEADSFLSLAMSACVCQFVVSIMYKYATVASSHAILIESQRPTRPRPKRRERKYPSGSITTTQAMTFPATVIPGRPVLRKIFSVMHFVLSTVIYNNMIGNVL